MKVGDLVRHTADLEELGIIFEVGFLPKSYMSVQAVRVQWTCGWMSGYLCARLPWR